MTLEDLRTLPDEEFYRLKRDVEEDAARRSKLAQLPEDLTALVQAATLAGITNETVRATVEGALDEAADG